ncbi:MAG: hypothetical protein HC800_25530 [Phormidesmis sp. RL_2_1]|nr:hypothetical protein [Phormidesmis sp. RL_2_1]
MESIFCFTAYNTEAIYGWGSEEEATAYLNYLNKDRGTNQYVMEKSDLPEEAADTIAFNMRPFLVDENLLSQADQY